jgi:diacylglycerol kinase family enzyme
VSETVIIANPASGGGRGAKLIPDVRDAFAATGVSELRLTTKSGDEGALTAAAIREGARTIVVLGGDGTWGRCAGAVLEANAGGRVRLALLSGGTGNDFAKNLGAPDKDFGAMARLVADPNRARVVDAGSVSAGPQTHYFLNCVGFGFDVDVLESTSKQGALKGNAVYIVAALKRILGYEGFAYTLGGPDGRSKLGMLLVVMNGANFGGSFRIAPNARVDDGYLDIVEIDSVFWMRRIPLFLRAMNGTHIYHSAVRARRGVHFDLSFTGINACDLDGELIPLPSKSVAVRCVPGALRVVA